MGSTASLVTCDACNREYRWKPELAGKRAKCKCGGRVTFPAAVVGPADEPDLDLLDIPAPVRGSSSSKNRRPLPSEADEGAYDLNEPIKPAKPVPAKPAAGGATCPTCKNPVLAQAVICTRCGTNLKTGKKLNTSVDASPAAAKRILLLKLGGALVAILALGLVFVFVAPKLALQVSLFIAIGGAIIGFIGLLWSSYIATHDNLGLRVLCRFVPFLAIVLIIHKSFSEWEDMKVPVLTLLTGMGIALLGLVLHFGVLIMVMGGAVGG